MRVVIAKRIPVAAGIGGGSADAAAVLRLANRLAGGPLDAGELRELAVELGSDVPSQVEPVHALVQGAGELVEPSARGAGVGSRLADECLRFARRSDYRRITLWTNDVLVTARRIYERAGFSCDRREPHHSFGRNLVGEYWSRDLSP